MPKPLRIQLLEFISQKGMGMPVNITGFITDNFTAPKNITDVESTFYITQVILFLDDIKDRGFIDQDNQDNGMWGLYEIDDKHVINWQSEKNDTDELYYYITSKGLDYLDQYTLYEITKKANRTAIITAIITPILVLVTVIISYFAYNTGDKNYKLSLDNKKTDSLNSISVEKRLDTLSTRLRLLKVSISSPKTSKTYPKQKSPK